MRLMSQAEYARHRGVHRSSVSRWVKDGRIQLVDGRIDPEQAESRLEATESPEPHHEARRVQLAQERAEKPAQGETGAASADESKDRIQARYKMAMMKEREAKAELAAMERDRQADLLVMREDVEYLLRDIGSTFRASAESLPDRLTPMVSAARDTAGVHSAVEEAVRDLLNEIADHMQRTAQEVKA